MVRTVRRTLLRSQLACNEMQASARTCCRRAAGSMIDNVGLSQVRSSQYTLIIPHRVIQLTTISFWVPETRLRLPQVNKSTTKNPSEASEEPSDTVIHFYFYFFLINRRALLSANQRQYSSNWASIPRSCWAKLFGPRI